MAFAVTNNFVGATTLSAANLDQNFTDIENLVNGQLNTSNFSGNAGITTGQLANNLFQFQGSLRMDGTCHATIVNNDVIDSFSLPYAGVGYTYTLVDYSWITTGSGTVASNTVMLLQYGSWDGASNAWTADATIDTITVVAAGAAVPLTGRSSVSSTITTNPGAPTIQVALVMSTRQASFLNTSTADHYFRIDCSFAKVLV